MKNASRWGDLWRADQNPAAGWAAVLVSGCLAGWLLWRATTVGLAFTPDGVYYLEAARSFAATGRLWVRTNCGLSRQWLKDLAPLYSILIAAGIKAGAAPLAWARVLNTMCAAIATGATAWGTLRLSESALASLLAGAAVATLPDFLERNNAFLSEPPCLALVMVGLLVLDRALASGSRRTLMLSAVLFSLAAIDRYAAVSVLPPALFFVLMAERSLRPVAAFLAAWLPLPLLLACANRHYASGDAGRPFAVHLPPASEWIDTAGNIAKWVNWRDPSPLLVGILLPLTLAAIVILVFRRKRASAAAKLAVAFAVAYELLVLTTEAFFDVTVHLSEPRYLILLFPLGMVALAGALPRWLLIPALAIFPILHGRTAFVHPPVEPPMYNGNHPVWKTSPTLERVGELDAQTCLYASSPDVIYLRYGRPAEWLPKRVEWFTGRTEAWCGQLRRQQLRHPSSAYIYFDAHRRPSTAIVSEDELTECLGKTSRDRLLDGTIFLPLN